MAERFGNYVVHERIGAGGMATVHRATLSGVGGFERQVALKRLLSHLAHDDSFVRAFVREARIAAQLRHPHVAQTFDLGIVGETYYIAMELIEGTDIRVVLKCAAGAAGPMPPPLVVNLLLQVCEALDYAHRLTDDIGQPLGIVHRDVSPANIIVDHEGTAKLIDFGIAKASSSSLMTMSGQLKGKFAYIAPETMAGTFDGRADLFSLGVVAHELLTAVPLLTGTDEIDTLRRVRELEIPKPSSLAPGIPEDVDTIVMTALARDPAERWQSAAAMRGALGVIAQRPNLQATPADLAQWIRWAIEVRPSRRRSAVTAAAARDAAGRPRDNYDDTDAEGGEPDSDSVDISMVVEPHDAAPTPAPAAMRAPRASAPPPHVMDHSAEELGAAPASSATLEMLVGGSTTQSPRLDVRTARVERTTAPLRTPNTVRRTPSRPQTPATVDMSQDSLDVDLEHRTTGNLRAFDPGLEPVTLVDVVDDAILAELNAGPTTGPSSQPTLMIHAGVHAAPDAVIPGRASRSSYDPVTGAEAPPSQGRASRPGVAPAPSIPTLEQMSRGRTSSAPPIDPAAAARAGRPSAPPNLGPPAITARSSAVPMPGAPPPGYAPPFGSAPPPGHVPAGSQQTLVAAGTPRGVNAAGPAPPAPYVALGDEYNAAAASYAQNIMTPPPGSLGQGSFGHGYGQGGGPGRPDPAQMAAEAIRDDQARKRDAARAASSAAALADAPGPGEAPPAKRTNTGATIVLFVLSALIIAGGWAAYYFT